MSGSQAADPTAGSGGGALGAIDRTLHRIEKLTALLSGAGIFVLMIVGVAQVLGRKFFNYPIFGYIDMVEIAMTTFAFLAISYADRLGGHIRMELLIGQLKGRLLWIAEAIGVAIGLFVVSVLIYYGYEHGMRAYSSGDSTIDALYPWWPSKMMVPLAFSILWLRMALSLVAYIRLIMDPTAEPVAVHIPETVEQMAEREAREAAHEIGSPEHKNAR